MPLLQVPEVVTARIVLAYTLEVCSLQAMSLHSEYQESKEKRCVCEKERERREREGGNIYIFNILCMHGLMDTLTRNVNWRLVVMPL